MQWDSHWARCEIISRKWNFGLVMAEKIFLWSVNPLLAELWMFLFADLAAYFWNFLARALAALDAVLLGHFSRSLWSLLDIVLQYFRTANQAFPMDNSDSVTSISGFHACIHPSSNVFSWDLPISQKLNSRGYTSLAVVFWVTDGKNILVPSACVGL